MKKFTFKEIVDIANKAIESRNRVRELYTESIKKSNLVDDSLEVRASDNSYEIGIKNLLKMLAEEK